MSSIYSVKGGMSPFSKEIEESSNPYKDKVRSEVRTMLSKMKKASDNNSNAFTATLIGKENGFLNTSSQTSSSKDDKTNPLMSSYKYKDISSKIQRAKTSLSAGQALISAKRTVLDIKRKLVSGKGDSKELIAALSHAKRMEMVARKKKHNLEMEEMVEKNLESEENAEKYEDERNVNNAVSQMGQEEIAEKEDEIFEERSEMLEETEAEMEQSTEQLQEISEFGEEELELLEQTMEMFESLEVANPHMSREDYEEMVMRHRNSERKAMTKADMDYLKEMFKMYIDKGNTMPTLSGINPESVSMSVDVVV